MGACTKVIGYVHLQSSRNICGVALNKMLKITLNTGFDKLMLNCDDSSTNYAV